MAENDATPNPVSIQDAEALIGVTAVLTGQTMGGATDPHLVGVFGDRLVGAGLLEHGPGGESPTAGQVAMALEALVQRLRYALGEYDERPGLPLPTRSHHMLRFGDEAGARQCADELGRLDEVRTSRTRVRDEGDRDWTVSVLLPGLSPDPEFDQWRARLTDAARSAGGEYAGSGNAE